MRQFYGTLETNKPLAFCWTDASESQPPHWNSFRPSLPSGLNGRDDFLIVLAIGGEQWMDWVVGWRTTRKCLQDLPGNKGVNAGIVGILTRGGCLQDDMRRFVCTLFSKIIKKRRRKKKPTTENPRNLGALSRVTYGTRGQRDKIREREREKDDTRGTRIFFFILL